MSAWRSPDHNRLSHQEARYAETRQTLAHALSRMERSLQRMRDVERQATPLTQRLLRQHVAMIEANIGNAEAAFLRAETDPTVLLAYHITSDYAEPLQPNGSE